MDWVAKTIKQKFSCASEGRTKESHGGFLGRPSSWIADRNLAMVLQVKRTGAFSGVVSKTPVLWDYHLILMASSNFSYFPFQNTAFRTRSRGNMNC